MRLPTAPGHGYTRLLRRLVPVDKACDTTGVDKRLAAAYVMVMQRWVRVLALALLATFAVAPVVQAASAANMSLTMALVDHGALDHAAPDHAASDVGALQMAGCDACDPAADEHGDRLACDALCFAPMAATLGQDGALPIDAGEAPTRFAIAGPVGCTGRPEPFPPRTFV